MPARLFALCALVAASGCGGDPGTKGPVSAHSGSTPVTHHESKWHEQTAAGIKALNDNDLKTAEKHFDQALASARQVQGPNLQLPSSLNNLARVYVMQDRLDDAEPLYQEAIRYIQSKPHVPEDLATVQHNLAQLYYKQKKLDKAEPLYARAYQLFSRMNERQLEADCLFDLAAINFQQGNLETAEQFFKLALSAREKLDGRDHARVADVLEPYAKLLRQMKRDQDAANLEDRAKAIRDKK